MTARSIIAFRILVLAILVAAASAFTGQGAGFLSTTCIATSRSLSLRRSAPIENPSNYHLARLHAVPSQKADDDDEQLESIDNNAYSATATPSKYDDGDPRQALEQFGSLFSLLQAIITEGSSWDSDTLEAKTQEFVRTYLRVFVPGLGYAITSFAVFGSAVLSFLLALSVTGRGYDDILAAVSDIEPLRNLLEKADPSWGNVAIALIGCEVVSPLILALTLALTPKTMDALQTKLVELGWGEDDIDERAADILRLTN